MNNSQQLDGRMNARELLEMSARRYQFVKHLLAEEGVTEETPGYKERESVHRGVSPWRISRLAQLIKEYKGSDKL